MEQLFRVFAKPDVRLGCRRASGRSMGDLLEGRLLARNDLGSARPAVGTSASEDPNYTNLRSGFLRVGARDQNSYRSANCITRGWVSRLV